MRGLICAAALLLAPMLAGAEVITKDVEYQHEDQTLQGYLAYDDSFSGERPGVLIIHQWTGLGDYEKERAHMLAEMGYIAFAADIYGKGIRPPAPEESGKWSGKFKSDRALFRERLNAGLEQLKDAPNVDAGRTAAIGYCFGGTGVIELARSGADVEAVVSFHGGLDSPSPQDGANITASVLALHGAEDPYVPADELQAWEKEMQDHDVDYVLVKYANAVHSFTEVEAGDDPSRGAAYNAKADRRSWDHMKSFLNEAFLGDE